MKLGKIGLIIVSLSSIFFTTSCSRAQVMTYDQAKAWVVKNCVEGKSTPVSGKRFFDFSKTFGDNVRDTVRRQIETKFKFKLDENLIGTVQLSGTDLDPTINLSLDVLRTVSLDGHNALFNVLNNKITITTMVDFSTIAGVSGKMSETTQFSKKGIFLLQEKCYYYITGKALGDRAAVIGRERITYSYK